MARTSVNVNDELFLSKYLEFQSRGLSFDDLSSELNLKSLSLYQRMNKLSKELSAQGIEIPKMPLKSSKKGKVSVDKLVEIFNSHVKNFTNNSVNDTETNAVNDSVSNVVGENKTVVPKKKKTVNAKDDNFGNDVVSSDMNYVDA